MKGRTGGFGEFSRHEVYDRASVVLDLFSSAVAEHPVVERDKELSAAAERAIDAIYEFYSKAAGKLMPSAPQKKRAKRRS